MQMVAGYADTQKLYFMSTSSFLGLSYTTTQIATIFSIHNFNNASPTSAAISTVLEDSTHNYVIYIEAISKSTSIVSTADFHSVARIFPPENVSSSPISIAYTVTTSNAYLLLLHDSLIVYIYDYNTT